MPGSYALNCANALGQVGGHLYATDFANNLYSVDPKTGAATLIGPTGMPPLEFAPPRANSDGTLDVVSESLGQLSRQAVREFRHCENQSRSGDVRPHHTGGLYQIDPSTGMSTPIASVDSNITAMVNVHDTVYAFDAWTGEVLRLDMTTGLTEATNVVVSQTAGSLIVGAAPARPSPGFLN